MSIKGIVEALEFVYNAVTKTALFTVSVLFFAILAKDCRSVEVKPSPRGYDTEPDFTQKEVRNDLAVEVLPRAVP